MTLVAPFVVGVRDGRSLETVAWAADLAAERDTPVVLAHATPPLPSPDGFGVWAVSDETADLTAWIDARFAQAFRLREVPYRIHVTTGSPATVLAALGDLEQAQAIVIGVRPPSRWRPRRLAATLPLVARRPVFAVPHADRRVESWLAAVNAIEAATPTH